MDEHTVISGLIMLAVVLFMGLTIMVVADSFFYMSAQEQACKDLGMQKKTINNFRTCIEPDGTAHITNFQCKGFLWDYDCKVQFIKLQSFGVEGI